LRYKSSLEALTGGKFSVIREQNYCWHLSYVGFFGEEQINHRHLGGRLFNDALSSPARTKRLLRRLPTLMRALPSKIHPGLRIKHCAKKWNKSDDRFSKCFWRFTWCSLCCIVLDLIVQVFRHKNPQWNLYVLRLHLYIGVALTSKHSLYLHAQIIFLFALY
jgi:hypothetical protein